MCTTANLAKIKAAHLKLLKFDPAFCAQATRNSQTAARRERRKVAAEMRSGLDRISVEIDGSAHAHTLEDAMLFDAELFDSLAQAMPAAPIAQAPKNKKVVRIEHKGRTTTIAEMALSAGVDPTLVSNRLRRGWSTEDACRKPNEKPRLAKLYSHQDLSLTLKQWSERVQISKRTLTSRLAQGWTFEAALSIIPGTVMGTKSHCGGWARTSQMTLGTSGDDSLDTEPKQAFFTAAYK